MNMAAVEQFAAERLVELPRIPIGDTVEDGVRWLNANFRSFFRETIAGTLTDLYDGILWVLMFLPNHAPGGTLLMTGVFALIALLLRSWQFALVSLVGFLLLDMMELFTQGMQTLSLVLLASTIAVALAIPIGVAAARKPWVKQAIQPVLDFMQTMPPFVYLIPVIFFFGIGEAPGIVATIVFAMPPGVRLSTLGIEQVDKEVVEAGEAFGASPWRILLRIQIPLAMQTIMAGVNQVIMLALSMVVISGMVGAEGLGEAVYRAITQVNIPNGVEAGLGVVLLAIYLDRITAAIGRRSAVAKAERLATA